MEEVGLTSETWKEGLPDKGRGTCKGGGPPGLDFRGERAFPFLQTDIQAESQTGKVC